MTDALKAHARMLESLPKRVHLRDDPETERLRKVRLAERLSATNAANGRKGRKAAQFRGR